MCGNWLTALDNLIFVGVAAFDLVDPRLIGKLRNMGSNHVLLSGPKEPKEHFSVVHIQKAKIWSVNSHRELSKDLMISSMF